MGGVEAPPAAPTPAPSAEVPMPEEFRGEMTSDELPDVPDRPQPDEDEDDPSQPEPADAPPQPQPFPQPPAPQPETVPADPGC
jgi:hypothetical protein